MKFLKVLAVFTVLISTTINFSSCGSKEKEPNPLADSLNRENSNLSGKLTEKEAALQEFVGAFNEIQENLNAIKEKEKIVTTASSSGDVKNKEDQIKEDIQAIYDLMNKNKNRIGSLTKKLKDANFKLEGLEKMIENLQVAINQKDVEIGELKSKIESLNIELASLTTNYKAIEEENAKKVEELNTAYYAIGTSKELKEKNVISREGGFIGIGKTTKVKEDFNKEYFTKVNIEQINSIPLGSKKVKVLTNHPKNTYKLVGENPVEKLEITDVKNFWSASKYLVIVIE